MVRRSTVVYLGLALFTQAFAAVPPLSGEVLKSEAENIFIGILEKVDVEEVQQREGVVNLVATATVNVLSAEKGEGSTTVTYWWPSERPAGWSGHQGLAPQPPKGVKLRFFATGDGELLLPNGWETYEDAEEESAIETAEAAEEQFKEEASEVKDTIESDVESGLETFQEDGVTASEVEVEYEDEEGTKKEVSAHLPSLLPAWQAFKRRLSNVLRSIRNIFRRQGGPKS